MKKLFAVVLAVIAFNVFAEEQTTTTAQEDAIVKLVQKLNERDLTIAELKEANLDLLVQNVGLKKANEELRKALSTKTNEYERLLKKYKTLSVSKMEEARVATIKEARAMLQSLDRKLAAIR
jgi:regulator of replication initiation timing